VREYRSTARREQAAATRRRILDCAERLFASRGYAAVTVEQVAAAASVAIPSVYASTGGKRELLETLVKDGLSAGRGDWAAVGAGDQDAAIEEMDDPASILRAHVANAVAIKRRTERIQSVLWRAATTDPGAAKLWRRHTQVMRSGQLRITRRLAALGALRPGLNAETAADIAQVLVRPETFDSLRRDCGWTIDQWAEFLEDSLARLLLG
jgi:AcrR family transcriptional regulator